MPLLIGHDLGSLDPKTAFVLDDLISALQTWATQVEGINAAERLSELTSGLASLPSVQTGTVHDYAGSTAPTGYLLCDGAAVSRTTYVALFTLIGTTFGVGNGTTTFNVPDLRQRYVMGKAASGTGSTLGSTFGSIDHTHTGPSHDHGAGSYEVSGQTENATLDTSEVQSGTGISVTNDGIHSHTITNQDVHGTSGSGGTGATGSNNPPTVVLNKIIKT